MKVSETAARRQNRPYRLYARATKLIHPRGLAVCKTLANKQPVTSRRETTFTQLDLSSEAMLKLIQFH